MNSSRRSRKRLVLATRVLDRGHDSIADGLDLVDGVVVERFALQGGDVTAKGVDRGRERPAGVRRAERGRRASRGGRRPPPPAYRPRAPRGGPPWRRYGPSRAPRASVFVRSIVEDVSRWSATSATMAASTAIARRTVARDARFTRSRLPYGHGL